MPLRCVKTVQQDKFPWLRYSVSEDCAYCAISMSFSKKTRNNMFITEGIRDWKNAVGEKQGILSNHCCSPGHLKATELSEKGQQKSINSVLSKAYEEKVILDIIIQLSKRNIALRGSRTGENEDGNPHSTPHLHTV